VTAAERHVPERVVAAHRGAKRLAPENTISAFDKALSLGAAALELDTHVTSDGRVVVVHDGYVDRTTDGNGPVRSMTALDIAALDAGSWHSPEFIGERIPTLEQVLELTKGRARLNIELKSSSRDAAAVIDLVRRHDAVDRSLVMSFDLDSVLAAKQHAPADLIVLPIVTERLADPLAFVRSTGMDGLNYPPQLWDKDLIDRFRNEGLVVHGGLINDSAAMQGFFAAGGQLADTDDPELY
jgi:glycerophosphoryl diester phosphodiesterase